MHSLEKFSFQELMSPISEISSWFFFFITRESSSLAVFRRGNGQPSHKQVWTAMLLTPGPGKCSAVVNREAVNSEE